MKQPTLDEFIAAYGTRKYTPNLYVKEKGFKQLYVRVIARWIENRYCEPTLDLANIEASRPGKGAFKALIARLRKQYPQMTLYVESVLNEQFRGGLLRLGFKEVTGDARNCFVIFAEQVWIGDQAYKKTEVPGLLEHDRLGECPPWGDCAI